MDEKNFEDRLEELRRKGRVVNGFGMKVQPKRKTKRRIILIYIILLIISILTTAVKRNKINVEDIEKAIERIANYS